MKNMEDRIKQLFAASIEAKVAIIDPLLPLIAEAGVRLAKCLLNDGKILICGNGGSAANCLHFSAAMISCYEVERPALPIIALNTDLSALTSVANNNHYDHIFARQINALAREGDLLLVLSTAGNTNNLLQAIHAANDRGIDTIVLNGRDGGVLASHLGPEDLELRVQANNAAQIRELHLFILHCFCDLIEQSLFGQMLEQ